MVGADRLDLVSVAGSGVGVSTVYQLVSCTDHVAENDVAICGNGGHLDGDLFLLAFKGPRDVFNLGTIKTFGHLQVCLGGITVEVPLGIGGIVGDDQVVQLFVVGRHVQAPRQHLLQAEVLVVRGQGQPAILTEDPVCGTDARLNVDINGLDVLEGHLGRLVSLVFLTADDCANADPTARVL